MSKSVQEVFTQTRNSREIYTLTDFFTVQKRLLDAAWGESWGTFIHSDPIQITDTKTLRVPAITYRLDSRQLAVMGDDNKREVKLRLRAQRPNPANPQIVTQTYGQRYRNIIEYGIWAPNWDQVYELSDKFEEFMTIYAGVLIDLGAHAIVYEDSTDGQSTSTSWRVDLVSRNILYSVYIEKTVELIVPTLVSYSVATQTNKQ